jgi:hypothetical protein
MAVDLKNIEQEGLEVLGSMNRPVPGESLTNSPESPRTWEQAPEYTNMRDALDFIVSALLEEETYLSVVGAIGEGIPISDVVQQILYIGFNEGKWNPDMILLLIEPLMYVLMALAEKSGIKYKIYRGEEEDDKQLNLDNNLKSKSDKLSVLSEAVKDKASKIVPSNLSLPRDIAKQIEQTEVPESLMAQPTEEEAPVIPTEEDNASLLAR